MNIPKHWKKIKLQNLILTQKGKKPQVLKSTQFPDSVQYLDIERLEKNVIRQYADKYSSVIADDNDLFMVWDGSRSGLVHQLQIEKEKQGAVASTIMRITPVGVNKNYLLYFLQYQYKVFQKNTVGDTIPHVNPKLFYDLDVYVPPIQEQERIVIELEKKLSEYQKQFNDNQQELEKLETYRQSVLERAVSGELTEDWREENNVEFNWEQTKTQDLFNVETGNTPSRADNSYWSNGNISWVKSGEVSNNFIYRTEEFITEIAVKETNTKLFPINTILIAMYGQGKTRGKVGILKIEATTNQAIAALINKNELVITNYYAFYFLLSQYHSLREKADGSVRPNLNLEIIKNIEIPIPSLPEQIEIVNRVEKKFQTIELLEKSIKDSNDFDKLQKGIFEKAFKGELSESQPNDEPVSVLLKKIKAEKARLEQERKELQKTQTQIKRTMGKQEKVVKSDILTLLKESGTPMSANDLLEQSKFNGNIDDFFAEAKELDSKGVLKWEIDKETQDTEKPLSMLTLIEAKQ